MATRKRSRYDDKFRASAVILLEAEGYPDKKGALSKVATHLGVPVNTLKGWYTGTRNPPSAELRTEKEGDLVALLETELRAALAAAKQARPDASYKDLLTAVGILTDKLQLLLGKPTETSNQRIVIEYAEVGPHGND